MALYIYMYDLSVYTYDLHMSIYLLMYVSIYIYVWATFRFNDDSGIESILGLPKSLVCGLRCIFVALLPGPNASQGRRREHESASK